MFRRGAKFAPPSTGKPRRRICALEVLEGRRLLSANPTATPALIGNSSTPGVPGYTPSQVLHAYGFDTAAATIGAVGGDGTGQTIAIVEAYRSPTLVADVQQFDLQFGIPDAPSLTEVDQNGGSSLPAANGSWGLESTLDVEWKRIAVAPAPILSSSRPSRAQLSDLLAAVRNTARNFSNVSVVSMSWGVDEFSGETAYDGILTTPAGHQPITFVAAVGDKGSKLDIQWPAASPNVVGVGGSTLTVNTITDASGVTETTWSGAVTGISQYESPPAYQGRNPTADGSGKSPTWFITPIRRRDFRFTIPLKAAGRRSAERVPGRRNGRHWSPLPTSRGQAPAIQLSMAPLKPSRPSISFRSGTKAARRKRSSPCQTPGLLH